MQIRSATLAPGLLALGVLALAAPPALAQSGVASIDTRTSLYLAGGNAYTFAPPGGGGLTPTAIDLAAGTGRVLTVSASGTSAYCGPGVCVAATPDGPAIGGTDLAASGRISGIVAPTSGFLGGLFLGATLPGSAPVSLDFAAIGTSFASLAPGLGQLFFIGDGATAGGLAQRFLVPDGATRLYFGIADGGSFVGIPGFYDDNVGTYRVAYEIEGAPSVVPEPTTWALVGTGLAALAVGRRRRARG